MPIDLVKHWVFKEADPESISRYARELNTSPLLSRILALRDFADADAARCYLSSSLRDNLPSPFFMADMEPAVERIVGALTRKQQIGIWGDYDVDGTTGTSVLVSFLSEIGAPPIYHVPHRIEEGYGLNIEGLRRLKERGIDLVVTVDCGISNAREVAAARQFGLDIVIVDHHQPPEDFPAAVAVINPHRKDCRFPDKGMCAAGLAFYLVIGLRAKLRDAGWFKDSAVPDIRHFLDIVTLGTIADMVPLKGVNRTLIKRGLAELANSTRPGVVALKQVAGIGAGAVSAGQVGFRLGPRINAAGRVDYGIKVVELLTTESNETAQRIAHELEAHNQERRTIETQVLEQALTQAERVMNGAARYSLVLAGAGWHPGVLGIVAARIVEKFYRPTVVIGFSDGIGKGSARSIHGFHMIEGFRRCAGSLEKFGGHEYAGGLSIKPEQLTEFTEAFEFAARQSLAAAQMMPRLEIDAELDFSAIGMPLMRELEVLQPFGVGNPEPVFATANAEICERKVFTGGVRYRLRQGRRVISGVIFGASEDYPAMPGQIVDVAYRLIANEWNGTSSVELKITDMRATNTVVSSSGLQIVG